MSENLKLSYETDLKLLHETNENFYEIAWSARHQLLEKNLQGIDDIQEALTAFRKLDSRYFWKVQRVLAGSTENGPFNHYYTGKIDVSPKDLKAANEQFLVSEQANKRQIDIILDSFDDRTDAVVELGAGYGGNLIRLDQAIKKHADKSLRERCIKLIMAEYTEAGRALCSQFLKRKNAPTIEIYHIDHKAPDVSFLGPAISPLFITIHSIEQVKEIPSNYFEILSRAASNVRGLHLEPVGFQFEPESTKWKEHEKFIKQKKWNQNFANIIKKAQSDGHIKIDKVDTAFSFGQPGNPTTLVQWHSTI